MVWLCEKGIQLVSMPPVQGLALLRAGCGPVHESLNPSVP